MEYRPGPKAHSPPHGRAGSSWEGKMDRDVQPLQKAARLHHELLIISNGSKKRFVEQVPGDIFHYSCVPREDGLCIHHFTFFWNSTYIPQANGLKKKKKEGKINKIKILSLDKNSLRSVTSIPSNRRTVLTFVKGHKVQVAPQLYLKALT